jgi:hypothetical protein
VPLASPSFAAACCSRRFGVSSAHPSPGSTRARSSCIGSRSNLWPWHRPSRRSGASFSDSWVERSWSRTTRVSTRRFSMTACGTTVSNRQSTPSPVVCGWHGALGLPGQCVYPTCARGSGSPCATTIRSQMPKGPRGSLSPRPLGWASSMPRSSPGRHADGVRGARAWGDAVISVSRNRARP